MTIDYFATNNKLDELIAALAAGTLSGTVTADAGVGTFTVGGRVTADLGVGTGTISGRVTADAGIGTFTVGGTVTANLGVGTGSFTGVTTSNTQGFNGTNWQPARIDTSTRSWQTVDYAHHEIHSGSSFLLSDATDVGNGASRNLLLVTPNTTKWAHLFIAVTTESEAHLYLYEDATVTGGNEGTPVTAYNRNRNSATAATVAAYHTPTIGADGTLIWQEHWGAGRSNGAQSRNQDEFILKQNSKYIFRVTNSTASNNYVSIVLSWYEHTDSAA